MRKGLVCVKDHKDLAGAACQILKTHLQCWDRKKKNITVASARSYFTAVQLRVRVCYHKK